GIAPVGDHRPDVVQDLLLAFAQLCHRLLLHRLCTVSSWVGPCPSSNGRSHSSWADFAFQTYVRLDNSNARSITYRTPVPPGRQPHEVTGAGPWEDGLGGPRAEHRPENRGREGAK